MNCVEGRYEFRIEIQGICLYKCERVVRLRVEIDTNDIESRSEVSGASAACATE